MIQIDRIEDWLINCSGQDFWEKAVELGCVEPNLIIKKYDYLRDTRTHSVLEP